MRISEVARAAGCSVRAIRHYHAAGALPEPERSSNGYREYRLSDLAALLRVRALVEAGIPLVEVSSGEQLYERALTRIDARLAGLHEQRHRLLALMDDRLGLPADIRSDVGQLFDDADFAKLETDALDLMGLAGVATDRTWEQLRHNLADADRRRVALRGQDAWRQLGRLRADDPAAEPIIREMADRLDEGLMACTGATLRPGDMPLTMTDIPTTGAQGLAVSVLAAQAVEP